MPAVQHILIAFHDFNRGGTERIAIAMAKHWVECGRRVTILCGSEGSSEGASLRDTVDPRVEVVELTPPMPRSLTSRLRLGKAMAPVIARLAPDIIFLPGNFHLPLVPALSKARGNGALVTKISNPALPQGPLALPVKALFRHFADCLDGVAAMNTGLERDLRAMLPHLPVATLFDPMFASAAPAAALAPIPDSPAHIVWAGRFEPQKDAPLAIATMAALRQLAPARLTMLGDGAGLAKARRQIAQAGLEDVIATPGFVASIDPWLQNAAALLVTSRYEGGPAVAVEALAHGVPVVSTDCSHFLHDVMTTPAAGQIVASRQPDALAHALHTVLTHGRPDAATLRGLTAHLAPERCATAYLDWFEQVLATRRAASRR